MSTEWGTNFSDNRVFYDAHDEALYIDLRELDIAIGAGLTAPYVSGFDRIIDYTEYGGSPSIAFHAISTSTWVKDETITITGPYFERTGVQRLKLQGSTTSEPVYFETVENVAIKGIKGAQGIQGTPGTKGTKGTKEIKARP